MKRLIGFTALALVLVTIAGGLGVWQLRAWQDRREAEARDLTQLTPVPLTELMGPDDPFPGRDLGRPVSMEGEWLPQGAFYVSGREDAGRDGLWLVVPLAVGDATEPAIPVVLGWTPSVDPSLVPTGAGSVTGWLQPPEGNGALDDDPDDDVVPQLRTADAIQRVDNDLYSAYAVATSPGQASSRRRSTRCPRSARSPRCATCSMPSSGGSSGPSRPSCGGAGCATNRRSWPPRRQPRRSMTTRR